jgi:hypothetical protein
MVSAISTFAAWSLAGFFVFLVIVQIIAKEIGFYFGKRRASATDSKDESIGIVSTSVFGLLVFALAFNLSIASTRYAERRAAVLDETNSLGTLWLQSQAVNDPRGKAIGDLVKPYLELRRDALDAKIGSPVIIENAQKISDLQRLMWGHLTALTAQRRDPQAIQLEGSMNAAFDSTSTTQFVFDQGVPVEINNLLLVLTLGSMAILGYQFGLKGSAHRALTLVMVLVWSSVMFTILDLGAAHVGKIRVDTAVYDSALQSLRDIPIPPLAP